jgi:predicted amidohydrolase YtcJ
MQFPDQSSRLIIHNARLYDPEYGLLNASAVRISGGILEKLGTDREILQSRSSDDMVIDANGSLILPAFTDAHTHFFEYVKRRLQLDLSGCNSLSESMDLIRRRVQETPEGSWITGGGWNRNLWDEHDYPTRHQLDEISTRHFIALDSKDWHVCWVNTPVLEKLGIDLKNPYPGARHLAIDPRNSAFTGVLEENARLSVYDIMPEWDYPRLRKMYQKVLQEFYRLGFGTIHLVETTRELEIARQAHQKCELGLRSFWYLPVKELDKALELRNQETERDEFIRIAGVKLFVDGAFGSQTAELLENYQGLGHSGVENMAGEELDNLVSEAIRAKLSCAIHAIGDRAIQKTLRVLGRYHQLSTDFGLRHRIEHAQMIRPEDIPLFAKYGIYASLQPIHLASDVPVINKYLGKRARITYPYKSLVDSEAILVFGSDIPIEDFNPWHAIYTAMERRYLMNPAEKPFFPDQKLDLPTCLQAYTVNSARIVGMENRFGRIQPGMKADIFIPDRDIFKISSEDLKETTSLLTVLNGVIVHNQL